jgi:predicted transcriptional regulator
MSERGLKQAPIGEIHGITQSTVSSIVRRENWKHLPEESPRYV